MLTLEKIPYLHEYHFDDSAAAAAIPYPAAPDFPLKRGRISISMLSFSDICSIAQLP